MTFGKSKVAELHITLALSSRTAFDAEAVAAAVHLRPYRVWQRKPDLIVHGTDTIPSMEWVFEARSRARRNLQPFVNRTLTKILAQGHGIRTAIKRHRLRAAVICRVQSAGDSPAFNVAPEFLAALARCKCTLGVHSDDE